MKEAFNLLNPALSRLVLNGVFPKWCELDLSGAELLVCLATGRRFKVLTVFKSASGCCPEEAVCVSVLNEEESMN